MFKNRLIALSGASLMIALGTALAWGTLVSSAQGDCRQFPETGFQVCGRFLQYWDTNGGLPQQGYPISGEFVEVSDLNGQPYTVQYFERAVFEYHPENAAPYDVLLTQLGTLRARDRYPSGYPTTVEIPFFEDRTGAVELLQSFFNAVNRKEYTRAYGYIEPTNLATMYDEFLQFYQNISLVTAYFGTPTEEGAAGSIFARVPFVAVGSYTNSTIRTFYGCFVARRTNDGVDPDPNSTLWRIYNYTILEAPTNLPISDMLAQGCQQ